MDVLDRLARLCFCKIFSIGVNWNVCNSMGAGTKHSRLYSAEVVNGKGDLSIWNYTYFLIQV